MVSSGSARIEYSKIGIDDLHPPGRRSSYAGFARCSIAFVASLSAGLLLLFLVLPSPPRRPILAHISPSLSQAPSPSPSPSASASHSLSPSSSPSLSSSLLPLCNTTSYYQLCVETLESFPSASSAPVLELVALFASVARDHVNQTYHFALNLTRLRGSDPAFPILRDCLELMDSSRDELSSSIDRLVQLDTRSSTFHLQMKDVQVWLSSSCTDQDTCSDDFQDLTGEVKDRMVQQGDLICKFISIALSLAETVQSSWQNSPAPASAPMKS